MEQPIRSHVLGLPRIGAKRELKFAVESFWQGTITESELLNTAKKIRHANWEMQIAAGLDFLTIGDFSLYDHVLDLSLKLGVIPKRFQTAEKHSDLQIYFNMARGHLGIPACEMTKWFDTNYHYLVPEFQHKQKFKINLNSLQDEIKAASQYGKPIKVILLGPLSYLWLGKMTRKNKAFSILPALIQAYQEIFSALKNVAWIQLDEPILSTDLSSEWKKAFLATYEAFKKNNPPILLTTYFGSIQDNLETIAALPVAGVHIDALGDEKQLTQTINLLKKNKKVISLGLIEGRNIWRLNFSNTLSFLKNIRSSISNELWISSSCSLLHVPVDLDYETKLPTQFKQWLSFAKQKLQEIALLTKAMNEGEATISETLTLNKKEMEQRAHSTEVHNSLVKKRCNSITEELCQRHSAYKKRQTLQMQELALPIFPTTTIGSFPQTTEIRKLRQQLKKGLITQTEYVEKIQKCIKHVVEFQEELGLDVLVHGEAERNDMVEYFAEFFAGFTITENGWVQSYGSRCVKPPILYGDVFRKEPITLSWITYAQSLTTKPVKAMLTGPNTMAAWSFLRDDQPRFTTVTQIALAIRDEVIDLEKAGIRVIQIDEPAFREGLPLNQKNWQHYLISAVRCFKLASCGVADKTQIHTHMCYSEFNDIIQSIADLDADVVSIEASRSKMELLSAFAAFHYPNGIGPGVYDVHSPTVPTTSEMVHLIEKAITTIDIEKIWINPDCGLKTRQWPEVTDSLKNMVKASHILRKKTMAVAPTKKKLLAQKLENDSLPMLFYEVIPPTMDNRQENIVFYASCIMELIQNIAIPIDAINIPEIRSEQNRNQTTKRTEPYESKIDTLEFAALFNNMSRNSIEIILNRCTVYEEKEQQEIWLQQATEDTKINNLILVGGESSKIHYPGPSVIEWTQHVKAHNSAKICCGGITIPNRLHEIERLVAKTQAGMDFFTSQIVFEVESVNTLLLQYQEACESLAIKPKRIFLSFAPISTHKDLQFLRWLGVTIPEQVEHMLFKTDIGIGWRSIKITSTILNQIIYFMREHQIRVPIGLNIEHINRHNFELTKELVEQLGKVYLDFYAE